MDIVTGITMRFELSDTESIHLLGNKSIFDLFFLVTNRLGRARAGLVRFQISSVNKRQGSGLCQT